MNTIDFLPESYHLERAYRKLRQRRVLLIALTAMTLLGWGITRHQQSAGLAGEVRSLEAQAKASKLKRSEMDKLREERKQLVYQETIQQQLDQPIAVTESVALIGRIMPESVNISRISINTLRPDPKPIEDEDEADRKKSRSSSKKKKADEAPPKDLITIQVYGAAPNDPIVAELVETMSDHAVFQNVKLHFSRADEADEVSMRRFHIEAEVPLDRRYVPQTTTAGVTDED